jgi:hypothetical protein
MALRDLKSSLKNLKVDKDRPFGGSSGLPYIKGGLPEDSPAGEYLADLARYSSEGTVRGGLFSVVSSATDSVRVSRFLNDFPKGLLFTSKQIGLQKSNPKIETGTRGEVLNTQVYSNSNLLAQIALQGTGEHVPRPGFNTNDLLNDENKYEKIVSNKSTDENRLVTLYNNKISPASSKILPDNLEKLGISKLPEELFNYAGGPGSSYGDGDTFIPRVVDTVNSYDNYRILGFTKFDYTPNFKSLSEETPYSSSYIAARYNIPNGFLGIDDIRDDFNNEDSTIYQQSDSDFIRPEGVPINISSINQFGNTMAYSELLSSPQYDGTNKTLQDFRQFTDAKPLATSVSYFTGGRNGDGFNRETRIGLGNPGSRTREQRDNFYTPNTKGQDKVNMTPIYRKSINTPVELDSDDVRDLIKFCIESIDNNHPDQTNRMHFRAFITNFSDNIGAEWDSKKYMGRGENFSTYQGFTREVGFTFVVAAQSVQEMEKMYQKLNYLASTLHPDYSPGGFMRGTIHQLTIGEYFYRTPGIITSMNISVDDNYPWEIKMKQPEILAADSTRTAVALVTGQIPPTSDIANNDRGQMELPQILKIQMSFKPIGNRLPQKGFQEPIIVNAGRNIGKFIANNYLERNSFKEVIKAFGGKPADTDGIPN